MSDIKSYRDLLVWQRAMDLSQEIYAVTKIFPKSEEYRITSQLIRAAISIPANIAEGHMRGTRKDYANFISIARGSTAELETLLMLAMRSELAAPEQLQKCLEKAEEVGRRLSALRGKLSNP